MLKTRSQFYLRKCLFSSMKVYKLIVENHEYTIKFGEYTSTGDFNLYCITG